MIDPEDDREQGGEEISPERNENGTFNEARERALERNAKRVYDDYGGDCEC